MGGYAKKGQKSYKKPYYKKNRYNKKRYYKKRRNRMRYTVSRTIGQPDAMFVKLKYNQVIQKAPAGITAFHTFRGNSLYDPDFTTAGGQPAGFDQYATIYTHYDVLASSIAVRMTNNVNSNVGFAIYPSFSTAAIVYDDAVAQSYARSKVVGALTGNSVAVLKNFIRTKKLLGRSTDSVNFAAQVTADPAKAWYWHVDMRSMDAATNIDVSIEVTLVFYAKFYQRTQLVDV